MCHKLHVLGVNGDLWDRVYGLGDNNKQDEMHTWSIASSHISVIPRFIIVFDRLLPR